MLRLGLFLFPLAALAASPIPAGPGQFTLPNDGVPIAVYTYRPPTYHHGPLIVVVHGSDRDAEPYRNNAISTAERCNALIAAPEFDLKRFPDEMWKRGGGVMSGGRAQPKERWTFNVIVRLVAAVREREGDPKLPFYVMGHSGGGQFAAKMAMFMPDCGAVRFVAANPGSNVFPTRDLPFPYGLGGLPPELSGDEMLRRYCAAPLTLYLGTGDVYQKVEDGFDFSANAMKQGPVRLARNHNFFNLMKQLAEEHGWPFAWRIVETPDIEHSGAQMFHAPEVADALFGPGPRGK